MGIAKTMKSLNISKIKSLSASSGMPNVANVLDGWMIPLVMYKQVQNVVDGFLEVTQKRLDFQGVWQPFTDKQLALLPEGQRAWSHYWLHVKTPIDLNVADEVVYLNKRYKVLSLKDYSLNGYCDYHLIRDYEDGNNDE